jgi:hypothetical protein
MVLGICPAVAFLVTPGDEMLVVRLLAWMPSASQTRHRPCRAHVLSSRHNHCILRIMSFNRQPKSFNLLDTSVAQGHEQHLVFIQFDDVVKAAFEPHKVMSS